MTFTGTTVVKGTTRISCRSSWWKKVLKAYEQTLNMTEQHTAISREVLQKNGNMSSPTVHYVLEQFMLKETKSDAFGLLVALGPGFSGEAVLLQWRD